MAGHQAVKVTAKEIERAQIMWESFTKTMTWSVVAIAALLGFLAIVFV